MKHDGREKARASVCGLCNLGWRVAGAADYFFLMLINFFDPYN